MHAIICAATIAGLIELNSERTSDMMPAFHFMHNAVVAVTPAVSAPRGVSIDLRLRWMIDWSVYNKVQC